MKTTVKVSISGIAFTIDEDAHHILNQYLNTLKAHFNRKPDGKEVVDDIEARLAELLSMRVSSPEQVVTLADAQEVIRIMGNPSDLFEDEQQATDNKTTQPTPPLNVRKRLYRDTNNKVIAGVCSGLGNYLNTDPIIFRLLFIIFTIGIGVIPFFFHFGHLPLRSVAVWTYIILWIALPKAVTPQQKLEMTGKNPSIDDIERKVRNERTSDYQPSSWRIANFIGGTARVFLTIIAGILLFTGIISLLAIVATMFGFSYFNGFHISINEILDIIGISSLLAKIALAIVVLYPLSMLIYWGSKLIFRFKLRDKMVMIITFCIWITASLFIAGYLIGGIWREAEARKAKVESVKKIDLVTKSDTLYVNLPKIYQESAIELIGQVKVNNDDFPRVWLSDIDGMKTLLIAPSIRVVNTENVNNFQIEIRKKTFARSKHAAMQQVDKTQLNYIQNDSLLLITPMIFNKDYPLRKIRDFYDIVIYAPQNKTVIIQEPLMINFTNFNNSFNLNWDMDWDDNND